MTISIIGTALFVALILLIIAGELEQRREWDKQKRDLKRENMVRQNATELYAFRLKLNREQLMREYDRWNATQWWRGE